tara:strand:+ start:346 stop:840 length:495 start_codon:yes stop_codon:yes gene_type:complete
MSMATTKKKGGPTAKAKPPRRNKREEAKYVFDLMDALTAPVITFSTSWADMIPKNLKSNIYMARMLALMKGEETATIPEVVAYLMTRGFEAPMHGEWVNIVTWCAAKYQREYEHKEPPPGMVQREELSRDEERLLKMLRRDIYESRRKALKEKLKRPKSKTVKP